ncbi:WalW protein [Glaciecola sp. MH2013]|uniref:WalW protein n=1 Tax=Glaciecola sp. MH2013 TaxID=2785524 RepID=UPI00189E9E8F|nr:WalW protein [Glaciecola sp. MH2013]MBF7072168.1 WalW protein [Glaciecola sp. MH2013]
MSTKPPLIFILTVDTEEEWDWEGPFPEEDFSVKNLEKIPELQDFFNQAGIRPTYFVDYAAAKGAAENGVFKKALAENTCELGAHLHPWANPPFFEKATEANSHVVNLPIEQVEAKLDALVDVFVEEFNYQPSSFRTGRWGISAAIMHLLWTRGFTVDSSVYPYYSNEFFTCQGSPDGAYWPDSNNVLKAGSQRNILEIQASVGFNRSNFARANKIYNAAELAPFKYLKAVGALWQTRLLRKIYMSPEVMQANDMISLAHQLVKNNVPFINMYFHSSNLISNGTGFFKEEQPFQEICKRVSQTIETLSESYTLEFMTLKEAHIYFSQNPHLLAKS